MLGPKSSILPRDGHGSGPSMGRIGLSWIGLNHKSFHFWWVGLGPLFKPELSMGCVGPRVGLGWVGSGSRIFIFSGLGWVMSLKWQICEKQMPCT